MKKRDKYINSNVKMDDEKVIAIYNKYLEYNKQSKDIRAQRDKYIKSSGITMAGLRQRIKYLKELGVYK